MILWASSNHLGIVTGSVAAHLRAIDEGPVRQASAVLAACAALQLHFQRPSPSGPLESTIGSVEKPRKGKSERTEDI